MNRRTYAKNLQRQIKVRIDEVTFNKITELSEKTGKTKSLFLRDLIGNGLRKLYKDQREDIINPPEFFPEGFVSVPPIRIIIEQDKFRRLEQPFLGMNRPNIE